MCRGIYLEEISSKFQFKIAVIRFYIVCELPHCALTRFTKNTKRIAQRTQRNAVFKISTTHGLYNDVSKFPPLVPCNLFQKFSLLVMEMKSFLNAC